MTPLEQQGDPPSWLKASSRRGDKTVFGLSSRLFPHSVSSNLIQPCDFNCHLYLGTPTCLSLFSPLTSRLGCIFSSLYCISTRVVYETFQTFITEKIPFPSSHLSHPLFLPQPRKYFRGPTVNNRSRAPFLGLLCPSRLHRLHQ